MSVVVEGTFGIYSNSSNECIDIVGSGNTIGEIAVEFNTKRNASAIAHEKLSALLLKKKTMITL